VEALPLINTKDAGEFFGLTQARIKQIIAEHGIPYNKEVNGQWRIPTESMSRLLKIRGVEFRKAIATIGIEKGGNGKTLLSLNTALTAAKYGIRTLVCDFDPESCSSLFLGDNIDWSTVGSILEVFENNEQIISHVRPSRFDGVDFLPAKPILRKLDKILDGDNPKTLLRKRMQGLHDFYDLILFDVPPNFTKLTASAYLTSDIVICPVISDIFSLESLKLTIEDIADACSKFEAKVPPVYILRNKFGAEKGRSRASRDVSEDLNSSFPAQVLPFYVGQSATLLNSLNDGQGIYDCPKGAGIDAVRSSLFDLFKMISGVENGSI
jgi:chromosome partitioning protein